jgi:hypothetical protein
MVDTMANLTCPHCKRTYELEMPINYCQILYRCKECNVDITPKKDDCCIFCSYADKKCPSMQPGWEVNI